MRRLRNTISSVVGVSLPIGPLLRSSRVALADARHRGMEEERCARVCTSVFVVVDAYAHCGADVPCPRSSSLFTIKFHVCLCTLRCPLNKKGVRMVADNWKRLEAWKASALLLAPLTFVRGFRRLVSSLSSLRPVLFPYCSSRRQVETRRHRA